MSHSPSGTAADQSAHSHGTDSHPADGFLRKYVFSQDHKVIGIQYGVTSLLFLLFGFTLMMMMRWQLAYPEQPIPALRFALPFGVVGLIVLAFSRLRPGLHMVVGTVIVLLGWLVWWLATNEAMMPGGIMLPEFYNSARRDARDHHGVPRRGAARGRRVRKLRRCPSRSARPTWHSRSST